MAKHKIVDARGFADTKFVAEYEKDRTAEEDAEWEASRAAAHAADKAKDAAQREEKARLEQAKKIVQVLLDKGIISEDDLKNPVKENTDVAEGS